MFSWSGLLVPAILLCVAEGRVNLPSLDALEIDTIAVGDEAEPHSWPWQVTVYTNVNGSWYFCGGSLIRRNVVLTAAHCTYDWTEVIVFLGHHNFSEDEPTRQRIEAESVVNHPQYDDDYILDYDIALVFLKDLPKLKDGTVQVVPRLSNKRLDVKALDHGRKCYVTGFGTTLQEDGTWRISMVLKELKTRVITDKRCFRKAGVVDFGLPDNVCTANRNDGICPGDSGGPLVCKIDSAWVQVGVVSYYLTADGCIGGVKGYARVSYHGDWIKSVLDS